ncbi:MAG: NAD-dependent epimerase/dehydratase family protein [Acidobacteria bacterium]|nr:MAG: NAD-dependent epimerase/dehydratase family protein [Acidobacteriota bacterium]
MKVLVTGGAGFIGSHIVDALLQAGHDVSVVDDLSTGSRENLSQRARFYRVDIRQDALADVFRRESPEAVCHQAARANVRESMLEPELYADVNILGSLNLLQCCRQFSVRKVVYASTGGAVYGEPRELPVREDHPINPLDPYGTSKHTVEHYLFLYQAHYGIEYTALRYPNVYGPRQNPYGEAGVVAIFANQMLRGQAPLINGTGDQERDFVFVADVVKANLLALTRGDGEILNIGSGIGTSVNQIFNLLAQECGYPHPAQYGPAKPGEVSRIFLDATQAWEKLGWRPTIAVAEGLRQTVTWFRELSRRGNDAVYQRGTA